MQKSSPKKHRYISPEEHQKRSESAKRVGCGKWMLGRKLSPETCAKLSEMRKGHETSQSTKAKISAKNKGENNGMYQKKHPEHIRNFIGEQSKLHFQDDATKSKWLNHPQRTQISRKGALAASIILADKGFSDTIPEKQFALLLQSAGIEYVHPYPIANIEHCYLADFYIPSKNLVIEVDGKYWHNHPHGRDIDHIRNKELVDAGYGILRLWEYEYDGAIEKIKGDSQ